jgi:hypothetical protein
MRQHLQRLTSSMQGCYVHWSKSINAKLGISSRNMSGRCFLSRPTVAVAAAVVQRQRLRKVGKALPPPLMLRLLQGHIHPGER